MAEQLSVEVNVKNVMEDTQTEQQYTQTSFFIWFGYDRGGGSQNVLEKYVIVFLQSLIFWGVRDPKGPQMAFIGARRKGPQGP